MEKPSGPITYKIMKGANVWPPGIAFLVSLAALAAIGVSIWAK